MGVSKMLLGGACDCVPYSLLMNKRRRNTSGFAVNPKMNKQMFFPDPFFSLPSKPFLFVFFFVGFTRDNLNALVERAPHTFMLYDMGFSLVPIICIYC